MFGAVLYLFPLLGAALFMLFSAYHFGETDLSGLRTETLLGKVVVLNYGPVILGIILLGHGEEVRPILAAVVLAAASRGSQASSGVARELRTRAGILFSDMKPL